MSTKIETILASGTPDQVITELKQKSLRIPSWGGRYGLVQEYDPRKHPVMNKSVYPDTLDEDGRIEPVTRIAFDLQRLATKRMTELVCGIPVKRIYKPLNDNQKKVASYIESIYERNRIDSVNIERCNMLFAGCEYITLWYAVADKNNVYGFESPLKLRCRNFSPMLGDMLYPLFDEYGDLIALSIGYVRRISNRPVSFFDTYTDTRHIKFSSEGGGWAVVEDETTTIGKIPAVYVCRPQPIWEGCSNIVYEIEWSLSRNGNYLRKNSKPIFVVYADKIISYGNEKDEKKEFKSVMQYPSGSSAEYVTWQQAVENLKYYVGELRNSFFTQLQLPDWSYEKMSQQALSGESRKQLFIDAQLKVKDESGRLVESYDREVNVIKAFLKIMLGGKWAADIDALSVENVITAFTITDEKDTITNLVNATGGKAIMSQREAVEEFGHSKDVDATLKQMQQEETGDVLGGAYE